MQLQLIIVYIRDTTICAIFPEPRRSACEASAPIRKKHVAQRRDGISNRPDESMSKANASSADHAGSQPANGSGGPGLAAIENWLQRAMADLARRGADDETPIDLTEGLKAMAALLQEAVHSRQAPHAAAPALSGSGSSTAAQGPLRAEIAAPADFKGGGETSAYASLLDPPGALDSAGEQLRAGGEKSLRLALTDLEAELGRRAARAGPASASAPEPKPGGEATSAARAAALAPREADAGISSVDSPDALTNLIESTRGRLIDTFETGLAAAATETRALKGAVQTLAEKIEAPRETAARDRAIKALERDVAAIAGHLAGADKGFAALATFEQMEQARGQIAGAAEAARRLASDRNEGRMAREAAELRAARAEADNRIHLALSAVHETLGNVDHTPARLATNPGATRPSRAIPVATMAPPPERRPHSDPATPTPDPDSPRRNPHAGKRDATGEAPGAEIDDFLIEPGAGFPRCASRTRLLARPLGERGPAENIRSHSDSEAPARTHAGGRRPEATPDNHAKGGFFGAHRNAIILAVATLSVALGAYALTCSAAMEGFEPPRFLKSIGLRAAPLERRSVATEGRYLMLDIGRDDANAARKNLRGPIDPPGAAFGFLDPAAIMPARKNPSSIPIAPATRAIVGGAAILPDKITDRAHATQRLRP